MEQTPGIGLDRVEVPPMRLGVEGAECMGLLALAGYAGENDQGVTGDIEIHVLEIVFPCPADVDESGRVFRGGLAG